MAIAGAPGIAQRDILAFSDPSEGGYEHLEWPEAYWPEPPSEERWDASWKAIQEDQKSFEALLTAPGVDLHKPFARG